MENKTYGPKPIPQRMRRFLSLAIMLSHLVLMPAADAMEPPTSAPRSSCPNMCGNVNIPYPFGIGTNCSWPGIDNFSVICNHTYSPPRPYYYVSEREYEIINISVDTGEMRIFSPFAYICFNSSKTTRKVQGQSLNFTNSPFLISPTLNQFTAIGGNTLAFMEGREDFTYYTGCITSSITLDGAAQDGDECTGLGCCQTKVAGNLSYVHIYWTNNLVITPINNAWRYSPCGYAFLAEKGWYRFSRRDLVGNLKINAFAIRVGNRSIPVVLDWAIRNGSCQSASACVSSHSHCVNATQGPGYLCKCSKGYMGNPYVTGPDGRTNINECQSPESYYCPSGSKCIDMDGTYRCQCKFFQRGKECRPIIPTTVVALIATFVAVVTACFAFVLLQTQKHRKLFNVNGGDVLKGVGISIFSKRELRKIINGYSDRIGGGYFGDVYKGIIKEGAQIKPVAVKCTVEKKEARRRQKALHSDRPQQEQEESWKEGFVREITFQFRNKHPNMVCLVGCCLETDIPILVFEFVSNGSLDKKLHDAKERCTLPMEQRLNIAIGSAKALCHMHSNGDYNHVHGDFKPANVLLDDKFNAKVSDFGSSKLLSAKTYAEGVIADVNYLDPDYKETKRFTVKSDVYSFGVFLLELITRKPARYNGKITLPDFFKNCWNEETHLEL